MFSALALLPAPGHASQLTTPPRATGTISFDGTDKVLAETYHARIVYSSSTAATLPNNAIYIYDTSDNIYYRIFFKVSALGVSNLNTYTYVNNATTVTWTDKSSDGYVLATFTTELLNVSNISKPSLGTVSVTVNFTADSFSITYTPSLTATRRITDFRAVIYKYNSPQLVYWDGRQLVANDLSAPFKFSAQYAVQAMLYDATSQFSVYFETSDPLYKDIAYDGTYITVGYLSIINSKTGVSTTIANNIYPGGQLLGSNVQPLHLKFKIATAANRDAQFYNFAQVRVWAFPYGLEGAFTITWDDGVPVNWYRNDSAFFKLAMKYNFYYDRYVWIYFPTANANITAPGWIDTANSTLLKLYQDMAKKGIYVDMHTPSQSSDNRTIWNEAFTKMNDYFGSEWGVIMQEHGTNQEDWTVNGTNPASNYYTADLIKQNYKFSQLKYYENNDLIGTSIVFRNDFRGANLDGMWFTSRCQWNNSELLKYPYNSLSNHIGKRDIDSIVADHKLTILYTHRNYRPNASAEIESLLKYIAQKPIWTAPPSTMYKFYYELANIKLSWDGTNLTVKNPTEFDIYGLTVNVSAPGLKDQDGHILPHGRHGFILTKIPAYSTVTFNKASETFTWYPEHTGHIDFEIYKTSDKIVIKTYGYGTAKIHVSKPWAAISVVDTTVHRTVNWQPGSVIFTATANHVYEILDIVQYNFNIGINWTYVLIGAMIPLMFFSVMMNFMDRIAKDIKVLFKLGGRK